MRLFVSDLFPSITIQLLLPHETRPDTPPSTTKCRTSGQTIVHRLHWIDQTCLIRVPGRMIVSVHEVLVESISNIDPLHVRPGPMTDDRQMGHAFSSDFKVASDACIPSVFIG